MIKNFVEEAQAFRDYADFLYDGIVVSYLDEGIRQRLGRENYINKYSMAIKFNPMSKLTTFLGYTFEVGQNGAITPMYHYSPVEFIGTIHTKSSGSSYKRFMESNLKVGDIIKVTYRNDVMPYVSPIECEQNRQNPNPVVPFPKTCPICGSELKFSDSGKTAICPNDYCQGRIIARTTNMLQKMNVKGFAEAAIVQLQCYTFRDLMEIPKEKVANILGPGNADNFEAAREALRHGKLSDYTLIGSLGFTGIAAQTWKLIFTRYTLKELTQIFDTGNGEYQLDSIKGIGPITITTILKEYPIFRDDMYYIMNNIEYKDTKFDQPTGLKIRFTGCRNLQLQEQLRNLGHDADGSAGVTKDTDILIIPFYGFTSTKLSKVGPNCKVIPINDFINNMESYLH
jgi:NAD-dependent DNA ligase